jgi:hypothetical protein
MRGVCLGSMHGEAHAGAEDRRIFIHAFLGTPGTKQPAWGVPQCLAHHVPGCFFIGATRTFASHYAPPPPA